MLDVLIRLKYKILFLEVTYPLNVDTFPYFSYSNYRNISACYVCNLFSLYAFPQGKYLLRLASDAFNGEKTRLSDG